MVISICIPQFNRIKFLLESLRILEAQTYEHIEIVISDDCSTDETEVEIMKLKGHYKYPIVYTRLKSNAGYDRNLRSAIESATGEYIMVIGNDDTINPECDLNDLISFIQQNGFPDIGFTNYMDAGSGEITRRAQITGILGSGPEVALKYYSSFSFVGGIIIKKSVFQDYNTGKFDGSIFTQIYLSCIIIASGHVLFSLASPLILKDVLPDHQDRLSYKDVIPRKWKDYRMMDGGLPSVLNVILNVFKDTDTLSQKTIFSAFRKIYSSTLGFWILEYRKSKALPAALGIIHGMFPPDISNFNALNRYNKCRIVLIYIVVSLSCLVFPLRIYEYVKPTVYNWIKK